MVFLCYYEHVKDKQMNIWSGLTMAALVFCASAASAATVTTSWYGAHWNGRPTASGEIFNHRKLTVAHRTLPMGTRVLIQHGKHKVVARVNDRGPYVRGRSLDVSEAVARRLHIKHKGVARVHMRVLAKNRSTR